MNMQRFIKGAVRLWKRQRGLPEDEKEEEKKAAYLKKLGLGDKLKAAQARPPWHLEHVAEGDVFFGNFDHPDLMRGQRMDLTFTVNSAAEGSLSSERGGFTADVAIRQDFPVPHEKGSDARHRAMAGYIFSKFNKRWRNFKEEEPSAEELQYISLEGLQLWFNQVAQVDGFPSAETFRENCADPEKGMSLDEFLKYTLDDDPEYLETTWSTVFTGRRIFFADEDLEFDGDFIPDAPGAIFGYVNYGGKPGGTFEIDLKPR